MSNTVAGLSFDLEVIAVDSMVEGEGRGLDEKEKSMCIHPHRLNDLTFVPILDVINAFEHIAGDFLGYFDETWTGAQEVR